VSSYTDNTPCLPLNLRITDVVKCILLHLQVKVLTYNIIWFSLYVNSVYVSDDYHLLGDDAVWLL
jgi:hypothetical protein